MPLVETLRWIKIEPKPDGTGWANLPADREECLYYHESHKVSTNSTQLRVLKGWSSPRRIK
jgi:hypothetical protein